MVCNGGSTQTHNFISVTWKKELWNKLTWAVMDYQDYQYLISPALPATANLNFKPGNKALPNNAEIWHQFFYPIYSNLYRI